LPLQPFLFIEVRSAPRPFKPRALERQRLDQPSPSGLRLLDSECTAVERTALDQPTQERRVALLPSDSFPTLESGDMGCSVSPPRFREGRAVSPFDRFEGAGARFCRAGGFKSDSSKASKASIRPISVLTEGLPS